MAPPGDTVSARDGRLIITVDLPAPGPKRTALMIEAMELAQEVFSYRFDVHYKGEYEDRNGTRRTVVSNMVEDFSDDQLPDTIFVPDE